MMTRFCSTALQSPGVALRVGEVHRRGPDDDEFVAAEPGDQRPDRAAQSVREHDDEQVAGVVAEEVVHRLEPVEVDEQRRDRARVDRREPAVEVLDQRPAVGQAGQLVVLGQVRSRSSATTGLQLGEQSRDRLQRVELVVGSIRGRRT